MLVLLALLGCHHHDTGDDVVRDGIFAAGCPAEGHAVARTLIAPDEHLDGIDALGGPGDTLLVNSRAAFVISDPTNPKTYYAYGGIPIDAVAVDGCAQAAPEKFGEMGFVIGQLDLGDFLSSQLRMFRGDSVAIVADGADGGPAIVDVHGTDDRFWLIELELIRRTLQGGGRKTLHAPFGLDATVRYTLQPDSAVLTADVTIASDVPGGYFVGTVLFPSDHADEIGGRTGQIALGGLTLDTGVPWLASSDGDGALAVAMPAAQTARVKIAGVTAMIDAHQAVAPLEVGPGQASTGRFALGVGPGDANTATTALCAAVPDLIPGVPCAPTHASGTVVDASGARVAGALVDLMTADGVGGWRTFDRTRTDGDGNYSVDALAIAPLKLQTEAIGRDGDAPVDFADGLALAISDAGALNWDIRDGDGAPIPGRIIATRPGDRRLFDVIPGDAPIPLPPGSWDIAVSRGYEYEPAQTTVTVPTAGSAELAVTLDHLVDTAGWMSFDGHVHTEASADSRVLRADRARDAAAVGLEVIVDTDHEVVSDETPGIDDAGVGNYVATVTGEEVTATSPEHTNAWPFVPDGTPRGGPVAWYGKGLDQIFTAERARGAEVVVLNHPRIGCNYLCLIDWDRTTGEPRMTDAAAVGLPTDQPLWSWNFDAVEVMNGPRDILLDPDSPERTGFLDDWLAMLNLGHKITGLGVSDSHDPEDLAWPRTYFAAPTDAPADFDEEMLVDSVLAGRAQISAGAFARVSANGAGIGEVASGAAVQLAIRVDALPDIDVSHVVVLANCDKVLDLDATDPLGVVKLDTTVPLHLDRDAHLVVMAFGDRAMPAGLPDYDPTGVPRVVTNAIYVDADGNGVFDAPGGKTCTY